MLIFRQLLSILYNNKKQVMSSGTEFVISLNRLTLPPSSSWQRVTLSVVAPPLQYFIQNQKIVKGSKVNFYRQNLFIHEHSSSDLRFNLYGIGQDTPRTLLRSFTPSKKQLQAVNRRPTPFRIEEDGYELVWESWIFTEESSYMNQESEKDYSELDLPFENKDPSTLTHILVNSQSQNSRFSKLIAGKMVSKKRASSTEQTSSLGNDGVQFSEGSENKNKQGNQVQKREKGNVGGRKNGSLVTSVEKRKKTHIKSHLYSYLVTGISELLSPTKA